MVNPLVATYRTKDDRHISLVFLESDRYWAPFCEVAGRPDLVDDERFADLGARGRQRRRTGGDARRGLRARRTFVEWKDALGRIDAPWAPVQAVEELLDDPQVLANDYLGEVTLDDGSSYRLPRVPVQFDEQRARHAPGPGARRAHRVGAAGARLQLGRHRGLRRVRYDPVTLRPIPVPDDESAPFWEAAAARRARAGAVLEMPAGVAPARAGLPPLPSHRPRVHLPARRHERRRPVVDGGAPVVPPRLRRRPSLRARRRGDRRARRRAADRASRRRPRRAAPRWAPASASCSSGSTTASPSPRSSWPADELARSRATRSRSSGTPRARS